MLQAIYDQCRELSLYFLPKVVVLDMEKAAINAFRQFFSDITVELCRFHWAQAVFRHIADNKLKPYYIDSDNETGNWLKLFFGLPLLPADEVGDAFAEEIMSEAPSDPAIEEFCDYVLKTYIEPDEGTGYPPDMWARMPDSDVVPSTTNGAEAFHRHLNNCFKNPHPNIYAFGSELLTLQEDVYVKLRSVHSERNPRSASRLKQEEIKDICMRFRSGQIRRADYMRSISFKFLPVCV